MIMNFKRKRTVLLQNGDTGRNQVKHLLLIILSFLLLSSPVIGNSHKGEILYRWENPSGDGYVWKGFGEKDTNPKYKGEVENGKPNGIGILIYLKQSKYVGEWKDGEQNGQGTFTWSDGTKYVGGWKDRMMNGQGTYTHPNGSKYIGEHKDDQPNGQGTMIYPDGEKCEGEWVNSGFRNGKCYYKNGNIQFKYVNGKRIRQ